MISTCNDLKAGANFKPFMDENLDWLYNENKENGEYSFQGGDISCIVRVSDGKIVSSRIFDPSTVIKN